MDFTGIISMWSLWLLLTIALGIFEIFTMSAIALCLAVATASGLIAALLGASPEWHIDSLERLTGMDFFPALPDSIETVVERDLDLGWWGL